MTNNLPSRVSVPFDVTAVVAAFVLLVAGGVAGWLIAGPARADAAPTSTPTPGADLPDRDFFLKVIVYDTANQGG
ncbi:MAG: hypothetical protein Q7T71_17435, partial [Herbiconiux sp.]|nr:hypothetical protein [Herbiconiux sp.]